MIFNMLLFEKTAKIQYENARRMLMNERCSEKLKKRSD